MHVLSTLDFKTIAAGVAVVFMAILLIKGMGTKPGGSSGKGGSSNSNSSSSNSDNTQN